MVVAESVTHAQVMGAVQGAVSGGLLRSATLFDVYRPKAGKNGEVPQGPVALGEKSLAVRVTLSSDAGTLTDAEIDAAMQAMVQKLVADTGARLRV